MNIAIGSIFQNSTGYLDRYHTQLLSLIHYAPEHTFDPILIEGDSTDNGATWARLNQIFPGHVWKREHGGPVFGSIDNLQRWMQISYACDGVLERVTPEHDALYYVESDLMWEPSTALKLINHLAKVEAVSPLLIAKDGRRFYDIWGYRQGGRNFGHEPPYHACLTRPNGTGLYEVDSAGGCIAVRGELARRCRFRPPTRAMVGFCEDMRKQGARVWVDKTLKVFHP